MKIQEMLQKRDSSKRNLICEAYAGTGKTFTIIHGIAWAFGSDDLWAEVCGDTEIIPSESQAEVWEWMNEHCDPSTIVYSAFNKSIVTEFGEKYQHIVDLLSLEGINLRFATLNSLGNTAIRNNLGWARCTSYKTFNILEEEFGKPFKDYMKGNDKQLALAVNNLVGKAKLTLAGWDDETGLNPTTRDMAELSEHFEIEGVTNMALELACKCLLKSVDWRNNKEIDFDDQNWLPIVKRLPIPRCDLLMVDEAQDLNKCKASFALRSGRQRVLVGDRYQAIYGWAGADTESLDNVKAELENDGGCDILKLCETFRCPSSIVALCNDHVGDFAALPEAPEGLVSHLDSDQLRDKVADGDMILSRVNAPLYSLAFRMLRDGVKVVMRGRDFAEGLYKMICKMWDDDGGTMANIDAWYQKEFEKVSKRRDSETALIALGDKHMCLIAFVEGCDTLDDVKARLEVFNDKSTKGILLSSIHRAKGLESDRVFFWMKDAPCPHPMAMSPWAMKQEHNLLYVARTRARQELWIVS